MKRNKISGGIYLVIDPSMNQIELIRKLEEALQAGLAIVQIWDNWQHVINKEESNHEVCNICHQYQVPVIINNEWNLLKTIPLDGVHFDSAPDNYNEIRKSIKRDFIAGITCNNDLSVVQWADKNQLNLLDTIAHEKHGA